MSLFGTRKDEIGDAPVTGITTPAAPPRPAAPSAARSLFGRGEDEMANIGKSITISGDLTGEEDLVIEGKVEGKVTLPNSQLTIGANGTIKAEVQAKSVVVIGRVSGNVRGTERVEIQATGIVEGDVIAPRLIVAEGAVVNGSIQMTSKPGAAAAHPPLSEPRRATGTAG